MTRCLRLLILDSADFGTFLCGLCDFAVKAFMMRFLGTAPIEPRAYLAGKLAALACWASLVARFFWPAVVWFSSPGLVILGAVLVAVGLLLMIVGGVNLGSSARVGLPKEQTALKTGGLYKYSRNPMYLGGFLTCLAAIAWTMNPIIIALVITTALFHHKIVLAEERFLAARFGSAWQEYSRRVRRYL